MKLIFATATLLIGMMALLGCTSPKKKDKGPTDMFGYPYKSRHDQVKGAFGG